MPRYDEDTGELIDDRDDAEIEKQERREHLGDAASLLERVHNERIEFPPTLTARQAIEILTNGSCGD